MSRASAYPTQRSLWRRTLVLVGLPVLLNVGFTRPSGAQGGPDQSEPSHHAGPPHHGMFRSSTLEGPPSPAFMRDSIQVSGKELQQYTQRYESYTASTKGTRDSLRTSMQAVRAAYQSGDRAQARTRRESVERQWKQLADKDKKFEDGLKNVLTKDQETRYQQWRQKRKEEAREQWRQRRTEARRNSWSAQHDSAGSRQPSDSGKAPTR